MKDNSDNTNALISIVLAAILGGGIPVFAKIGVQVIPPLTFSFLRFLLATFFIIPIILYKKPKFKKTHISVFLISLFASLNIILFAFGIQITSATMAQTLGAGMPFMVLILSYLFLHEKMTYRKLFGIGIGFLGLLIIIISPVLHTGSIFKGEFIGNVLVFVGVVLFALYSVCSKQIQETHSPIAISIIFILTTLFVTSITLPFEASKVYMWFPQLSFKILFSLVYVGSIGGIVYYFLQQQAIKHGSPLIASMLLYLQPVFTYFWAFILLGERLTLGFIIGAVLTFVGAGIITLRGK